MPPTRFTLLLREHLEHADGIDLAQDELTALMGFLMDSIPEAEKSGEEVQGQLVNVDKQDRSGQDAHHFDSPADLLAHYFQHGTRLQLEHQPDFRQDFALRKDLSQDFAFKNQVVKDEIQESTEGLQEGFNAEFLQVKARLNSKGPDVETAVCALLASSSPDLLEDHLVSLLGFEDVELLMQLIQYQSDFKRAYQQSQNDLQEAKELNNDIKDLQILNDKWTKDASQPKLSTDDFKPFPIPSLPQPPVAAGFTVTTSSAKQQLKDQRKQEKRDRKQWERQIAQETGHLLHEEERQERRQELIASQQPPVETYTYTYPTSSSTSNVNLPHVYDASLLRSRANGLNDRVLSVYGQPFTLPQGSERRDTHLFEEISIPAASHQTDPFNVQLVSIDRLEKWARPAFKGYKTLNRMQSLVFEAAFKSQENLLVCAPTGAGKTDVAMLTVLSTIGRYLRTDKSEDEEGDEREEETESTVSRPNFHLDDFKIVYVAPMKALASEVVRKFQSRLQPFGIQVRELTGDTQLSRSELQSTQLLVTTPEKWDVITRKPSTASTHILVRLMILDEVHLLHDDRGSVLESLVARTLRWSESSQSLIRLVGLSATLPNCVDVAQFLRVHLERGLFYFDASFRPVPLEQVFVGVKSKPKRQKEATGGEKEKDSKSKTKEIRESLQDRMNEVLFERVLPVLEEGKQVMVFVHARKETLTTALALRELALIHNKQELFTSSCESSSSSRNLLKEIESSRNRELKSLLQTGIGIHHAGLLRSDRRLSERLFEAGLLTVLVCTSTLAWGVNLPAHAVIIKGTQLYDPLKGGFIDLGILDLLQIFGRAGRPQFESHGLGVLLTTHDRLAHYVSRMTQQLPIESTFAQHLVDNLNAEISCTGSVTTIEEAVQWLGYTYLHVRMLKNPHMYGLLDWDPALDPGLVQHRRFLCIQAARDLVKSQMIEFDEKTGRFTPKDLGRTAASFYLGKASVDLIHEALMPSCTETEVLAVVSCTQEFSGIKVREEEIRELKRLVEQGMCPCDLKLGPESEPGKINLLMQAYISRASLESFSLVSDSAYIAQNAPRIFRALFEITLKRKWGSCSHVILSLCKSFERRQWSFEHPLLQFSLSTSGYSGNSRSQSLLPLELVRKLDQLPNALTSISHLRAMSGSELGDLVRNQRYGDTLAKCVAWFPELEVATRVLPITRTVVRLEVTLTPTFEWSDRYHGSAEPWWVWVEDSTSADILAHDSFVLQKNQMNSTHKLGFIVPITEPLPQQLYLRVISDRWIGAEVVHPISFRHLVLPQSASPFTELLDLAPLPLSVLQDKSIEALYEPKFTYFNPIQTQCFHSLYHTDHNILLGAPTSSGKTCCAELAVYRAFRTQPQSIVVYIAPLKALVRERLNDWRKKWEFLDKRVIEMTGDSAPDPTDFHGSVNVIITTPEKWDGLSRQWRHRNYITAVSLVVIDEIHLLGSERGPILEMIVSRMNYISFNTGRPIRIVGLSTALANATDLAAWLNVHPTAGLFNFRNSVRPIPLEIYIDGFPGRHYCPRMSTMNKPAFQSILRHSPSKPVIIFVSSRRQTRLTAKDLISLSCTTASSLSKRFLHMPEDDIDRIIRTQVVDPELKHCLSFGIGLHHAGLTEGDRQVVEELFVNMKIQVLVATSTVAWGVNYPAHLVIIKGTEFYDAKTKRYVDFPVTDVLQMMGRAGRPQFDDSGIAHVMVHDVKKSFYKKFLHEPFPVESSLFKLNMMDDHLNAEIVAGTIRTKQDAVDFLTWTYFYRRLRMNPTYYGLIPESLKELMGEEEFEENDDEISFDDEMPTLKGVIPGHAHLSERDISLHLSRMVETVLDQLEMSGCVEIELERLVSTDLGLIASFYYLRHETVRLFRSSLAYDVSHASLLDTLSRAREYDELPVRHNEDRMNEDFALALQQSSGFQVDHRGDFGSPHVKAHLLFAAHLCRYNVDDLPITDYWTDTKSVLDQSVRILQGMIDVCAGYHRHLRNTLRAMEVLQSLKSASKWSENSIVALSLFESVHDAVQLTAYGVECLPDLLHLKVSERLSTLEAFLTSVGVSKSSKAASILLYLPLCTAKCSLVNSDATSRATYVDVRLYIERRGPYPTETSSVLKQTRSKPLAYHPRFPKPQPEGWFVVLADGPSNKVYAVKRCQCFDNKETAVRLTLPDEEVLPRTARVWLMSDVYIGLDQEIEIFKP